MMPKIRVPAQTAVMPSQAGAVGGRGGVICTVMEQSVPPALAVAAQLRACAHNTIIKSRMAGRGQFSAQPQVSL